MCNETCRIIPRHRFLTAVRGGVAQRPFPVQPNLTMSDATFAQRVALTSVDEYLEFKRAVLAESALSLQTLPGARPAPVRAHSF